jgi:signal-transduction protein with cAMP-binding, CBS, and nucleotidyltransferase domain
MALTIPIRKIMNQNLLSVGPSADARSAARLMTEKNVGSLLVKKDDDYIGILTETDIVKKVLALDRDPKTTTVEEIMSYPIASLDEEALLAEAQEMMGERQIRHLLVTRKGRAVGMISVRSLLDAVCNWMLKMSREPK